MRQSAVASRASHGALLNSHANAAAKLLEKKKEFDAVSALERASTLYLERIEGLGEDCDIMADAGQAHGQVLEQWPQMFQILSLFLTSSSVSDRNESSGTHVPLEGQQLVRVPIEDIQRGPSNNIN